MVAAWIEQLQESFASSPTVSAIEALRADSELSSWLGSGLALRKARSRAVCLLCDQPMASSRVKRLKAHFSDSYRNFARVIVKLIQGVSACHTQVSAVTPPEAGLTYPQLVGQLRTAQSAHTTKDDLLRLLSFSCCYSSSSSVDFLSMTPTENWCQAAMASAVRLKLEL